MAWKICKGRVWIVESNTRTVWYAPAMYSALRKQHIPTTRHYVAPAQRNRSRLALVKGNIHVELKYPRSIDFAKYFEQKLW